MNYFLSGYAHVPFYSEIQVQNTLRHILVGDHRRIKRKTNFKFFHVSGSGTMGSIAGKTKVHRSDGG